VFAADVVQLATELAGADPATCDRAGLVELVRTSQRLRGWLDAFDARIALHTGRLADHEPAAAAAIFAGDGRRSAKDAEAVGRRAEVCALLPAVHDALAAGAVSAGHADALAQVAGGLDDSGRSQLQALESTLVESARQSSVDTFTRQVRQLGRILTGDDGVGQHERLRRQRSLRRWVDRHTGMCHTHLQLDPEADAKISAALDAAISAEQALPDPDQRSFDQLRADAMVNLITGARGTERRVPEVSVLIDHDTLSDGLHDDSVCETDEGQALPPDTVRRLCCDADIIPIVLNGAGVALDVGRERRVATRAQRRALRAMYRTCAHPGCTVRFADCDIHHVTPWNRGGRTCLANLLPLCSRHHHLVHEGRWQLTLHPDRTITLTDPDGTAHHHGPTITTAPSGVPAHETTIITLARARARALGPPSRAPAA
jgi:Domain of unknown function (DUF222)